MKSLIGHRKCYDTAFLPQRNKWFILVEKERKKKTKNILSEMLKFCKIVFIGNYKNDER